MSKEDRYKIRKMPVLSERMQRLLDMLLWEAQTTGVIPCVLDIGCDHAFISIACIVKEIANHVIAMDVRKGPLAIAQANIELYGMEKKVETRLSDGFEHVRPDEASWAVIAGMGGELMCNILRRGREHLDAGIGLVLQPQSEIAAVRSLLAAENYTITDEDFLQEDSKFYTIIKAKKTGGKVCMDAAQLEYGPVLLHKKNPKFKEYLDREYEKKQHLMSKLAEVHTETTKQRCRELEQEIVILRDARRRIDAL